MNNSNQQNFKKSLLVFFFTFSFITAAISTVYYVSNNGDYSNAGSISEQAWRTLDKINEFHLSAGFQHGDLSGLQGAVKKYSGIFIEARGRGLMQGFDISMTKNKIANKLFAFRIFEKGIYFGYFGPGQNVIRIEPPLTLSKDEADIIISIVYEVADEMQ